MMGDFTQQGEYAGKELFYKSKLSLTPKHKVAFRLGGSEDFARKGILIFLQLLLLTHYRIMVGYFAQTAPSRSHYTAHSF
jgi:hypothetical protein